MKALTSVNTHKTHQSGPPLVMREFGHTTRHCWRTSWRVSGLLPSAWTVKLTLSHFMGKQLISSTPTFLRLNHLPRGGIYDDPKCTPGSAHSALIYGYGTARLKTGKVVDYWLCKNSWSTSWGDKGYFKMVRGKNMCGLTSYLIYPLV